MNTLLAIQCELKAPKGQKNQFGNFYYRNCEDILFAVKPILRQYDAELYLTDEVVAIGNYVFLKATATLKIEQIYISTGYAMLDKDKKGMDAAQITGAASSYARKYALCGLFLIDGGDDADALCPAPPAGVFAPPAPAPAPAISAAMPTPPPPPPKK